MTEAELLFRPSFSPPSDDGANSLGNRRGQRGPVGIRARADLRGRHAARRQHGHHPCAALLATARFQRWLNSILAYVAIEQTFATVQASLGLAARSLVASFDPNGVLFPTTLAGARAGANTMCCAKVNLFDIPKVMAPVLTLSTQSRPVLMNYPINRTDFHLVRGVLNTVQFFIHDVDRHVAASLLGGPG